MEIITGGSNNGGQIFRLDNTYPVLRQIKSVGFVCLQGMRVRPDGPQLISEMVRKYLGIDCSVLMGPNIAGVS